MKKVITVLLLSVAVVALIGSSALAAPFEAWHGTGTLYQAIPTGETGANTTGVGTWLYTGTVAAGDGYDNLWTWTNWWNAEIETFQSGESESCPLMTTTIGGLNPADSYDVYVQYWGYAETSITFGVQAALSGGTLVDYSNYNAYNTNDYTISQYITDGGHALLEAYVGTVTGVTSVAVDIDDGLAAVPSPPTPDNRVRSSYYGLSIIPEPATMLVLAIGGMLSLIRRKK